MRKKTAKKPAVKTTAPQTTEVKEVVEVKEETVVTAPVEKDEAVKEATVEAVSAEETAQAEEKETVKKTTTKKTTTKKAAEKKDEMKPDVYIQFAGQEAVLAEVIEKAKKQFVDEGHRAGTIKSLQVYLKPEEYAAYYVINQKHAGRVDLF